MSADGGPYTLAKIAEVIGAELSGRGDLEIHGIADIRDAKPGEIAFVANPKYLKEAAQTKASAVIVSKSVQAERISPGTAALYVDDPYLAFASALSLLAPKREKRVGVDSRAVLGDTAAIGEDVWVQPYAVIADGARIGRGTVVGSFAYIGEDAAIGEDCLIYPHVTIREGSRIGSRVILHSGVVIGSDGFGFAREGASYRKIPQVGTVLIGDDVEIGANAAIDRAAMPNDATVIGNGVKIDNLVQVGHNVKIGDNSLIVALVGLSGSVELGQNVTIAGQTGLAGHLRVGDNTVIAARSGVTKDVPSNSYYSGFPAIKHSDDLKHQAYLRRMPRMAEEIRALRKRVEELEADRGVSHSTQE